MFFSHINVTLPFPSSLSLKKLIKNISSGEDLKKYIYSTYSKLYTTT